MCHSPCIEVRGQLSGDASHRPPVMCSGIELRSPRHFDLLSHLASPTLFEGQGLSLNLKLTDSLSRPDGQPSPGFLHFLPPGAETAGVHLLAWPSLFLWMLEDLNSGPRAHIGSTFLAEPATQNQTWLGFIEGIIPSP